MILSSKTTDKRSVRVAFYMRVSTAEQDIDGYSPQFQKSELEEHVKRKSGYKGWYTKEAWHFFEVGSGSSREDRKELKKLMALVSKKEIDLVLVWKIDRLSRNLSDLLDLFQEMDRHNVCFASVKEDLDFSGPIGKLIYQIFGALAEFERETIRMRTEEGKRQSAKLGNYVGGSIPYGFIAVPNKQQGKGKLLEVVKEECAVVRQIFEWYVFDDQSARWIAAELNRKKIPKGKGNVRNRGTAWNEQHIGDLLSNTVYRGTYITNRFKLISKKPERYEQRPEQEWIMSVVPSIINDVLFYKAQEKLRNKGRASRRGGGKETYMLRGKIVEATTGRKFVGYIATKGTKNYRRKLYKAEDGTQVSSMSIAARDLEEWIWSRIQIAIDDPHAFFRIHKKETPREKTIEQLSERLKFYETALSRANTRIERLQGDFYDGNIEQSQRDERLMEYSTARDAAFVDKRKVEHEINSLGGQELAQEHVRRFSANFEKVKQLSYEDKQKVVDVLVDRVEITQTEDERKAKVYFHFDPVAISAAIPVGRTDVASLQAEKPLSQGGDTGDMVGREGLEPSANSLKGNCSTN